MNYSVSLDGWLSVSVRKVASISQALTEKLSPAVPPASRGCQITCTPALACSDTELNCAAGIWSGRDCSAQTPL